MKPRTRTQKALVVTAVAIALVTAAACKTQDPTSETQITSADNSPGAQETSVGISGGVSGPMTPTTPTPLDPLSKDDRDFITKATQGGMLEVSLGNQAAQKGITPAVKAFGAHMVNDHQQANDELKALALQKGVTPPSTLDDDHQKKIDELGKLTGKKFDAAFSKDMVKDHEEDVKEFEEASKDLKDADLRAWASKTLPTLRTHLQMAKDMKAKAKK